MSFLLTFYVAVILFYTVLSQSFYPIMLFILGKDVVIDLSVNWSEFSLSYCCVIIGVLLLLMTLPRDTSYIRGVNAFGVVFVIIFITFVVSTGIGAMFTTDYTFSKTEYEEYLNE